MKRFCLALLLMACAPNEYNGAQDPAPERPPSIYIHNQSTSPIAVYTSRMGSDRNRLSLSAGAENHVKLGVMNLDDIGCMRVIVHYIGGKDWISPTTCMLRGGAFDLTVSEQMVFNALIITR